MAGDTYPADFLQEFLLKNYDQNAFQILCQDLEIPYDSLPGKRKDKKVRELVRRLERCSRLNDLAIQLKKNPIFLQEEKKFRHSLIPYGSRLRFRKFFEPLMRVSIIVAIIGCIGTVFAAVASPIVEELIVRYFHSPTATLQTPTSFVTTSSITATINPAMTPTLTLSPASTLSLTATLSKDSTPVPSLTFTLTLSPSATPTPIPVSPIPLRELAQLCSQGASGCSKDTQGLATGAVSPNCSLSDRPGAVEFSWHNVQESQDFLIFTFSLRDGISSDLVEAAERNSHLIMWVLGENGQEKFIVKLLDREGEEGEHLMQASEEWQQNKIPLSIFRSQGVNIRRLDSLVIAFEHFSDAGLASNEGRICIGEIGFGSP